MAFISRSFLTEFVTIMSFAALALLWNPQYSQANERDGALIFSFAGLATGAAEDIPRSGDEGIRRDQIHYGLAALVEGNLYGTIGIESGVLLVKRVYEARSDVLNASLVQEATRLHIPILARFWISDFFSIGAGPYVSFKVGSVKNAAKVGNVEAGFQTSAEDELEYGLDFAGTFNFALADKTGIFVEGRYSMDLDKEDQEKSDQVSALLGVKFAFGG